MLRTVGHGSRSMKGWCGTVSWVFVGQRLTGRCDQSMWCIAGSVYGAGGVHVPEDVVDVHAARDGNAGTQEIELQHPEVRFVGEVEVHRVPLHWGREERRRGIGRCR